MKGKSFRVHSLHVTTNLAHFVISLLFLIVEEPKRESRLERSECVFFSVDFYYFQKKTKTFSLLSVQVQLSDYARRASGEWRDRRLCANWNSFYRLRRFSCNLVNKTESLVRQHVSVNQRFFSSSFRWGFIPVRRLLWCKWALCIHSFDKIIMKYGISNGISELRNCDSIKYSVNGIGRWLKVTFAINKL